MEADVIVIGEKSCVEMEDVDGVEWNSDEGNVNWEEGSEESYQSDGEKVSDKVECTIRLTLPPEDKKQSAKKKRVLVQFTEDDYTEALTCHEEVLAEAVSSGVSAACACFTPDVFSAVLSVVGTEHSMLWGYRRDMSLTEIRDLLASIGRWLRSEFRALSLKDVSADEGRDGSPADDLLACVLQHKAGTCHQINQIYCAALHVLGWPVRYVRTVDGGSLHPSDCPGIYERRWKEVKDSASEKFKPKKSLPVPAVLSWIEVAVSETPSAKDSASASASSDTAAKATTIKDDHIVDLTADDSDDSDDSDGCVVLDNPASSSSRWVPVDLEHGAFDQPQKVEAVLRRGRPVQYVLAFEPAQSGEDDSAAEDHQGSGEARQGSALVRIVNVTSSYAHVHRYATAWEKKTRSAVDGWMEQLLRETNDSVRVQVVSGSKGGVVDLTGDAANRSSTGIYRLGSYSDGGSGRYDGSSSSAKRQRVTGSGSNVSRCPLPTRVGDFKDHPVYLLQRHLLCEQALHPSARPVALFKGESVYLQSHKEALRTKLQWRRQLRQVRGGEEPVKLVKRSVITRGGGGGGDGDGGEGGGEVGAQAGRGGQSSVLELKLFGSWQTEPIKIQPVADGILPVNKYGNIEVWEGNKAFVPAGAKFIENPRALKTAQSLGLPCAGAVTGFERRGMHTVPIVGGVVVLREHAELVKDASYFVEAVKEETLYQKRDRELTARWERLAHGLLSLDTLRKKYVA